MTESTVERSIPNVDASETKSTVTTKDLPKYGVIAIELFLLFVVIYAFRIEREHGLIQMLPCAFGGFLLFYILPRNLRLPFLTFLSLFTFLLLLGVGNGLILIAIGSTLILLCHLPVSFWLRVTGISAIAILLTAIRLTWIPLKWGIVVVPMLASMFMFRLILYLYELRQKNAEPATVWHRVSYFFMLPNICFPFFPIVDYRTYVRSWLKGDPLTVVQKGITWMALGIAQLLLYRIIYTYLALGPGEVVDTKSLLLYLGTSYAVLIKLSGQAHFIVGILCLFGFDLPRVFDNYFLASGPSDYWRRINVYWKDFMMRVFHYPVFFRLRSLGLIRATFLTLVFVFIVTAVLHAYQFFWLQGVFRLTVIDVIFWGVLGTLVISNSMQQMNRKKNLGRRPWNFREAFNLSFQTCSFFVFMCILWSIWKSASVHEWISLFLVMRHSSAREIFGIGASFAGIVVAGAFLQRVFSKKRITIDQFNFLKSASIVLALLIVILVLRMNRFYVPRYSMLEQFVTSIKSDKLATWDAENQERGYYENVMNSNRVNVEAVSVGNLKPLDWVELHETKGVRFTDDILIYEPLPNARITFKNRILTTNQWGMRDQPYEKKKPAGTYRFALLGGSYEMGSGVADHETFESLVEERLNQLGGQNYEILNFAVGGYGLERIVKVVDTKVFPFQPDAVLIVAHTRERERTVTALIRILNAGVSPEYDFLKQIVRESGFRRDMSFVEAKRSLLPYADRILEWSYRRISQECLKHGSTPVWIFLPTLEGRTSREEVSWLLTLAGRLGFVTIDLTPVYGTHDLEKLQCATWDTHPGSKAHKLISNLLFKRIVENQHKLNLNLSAVQQKTE